MFFESSATSDGWLEITKTIITVVGTIVVAYFGNRVWKKRKETTDVISISNVEPLVVESSIDSHSIKDVLTRLITLEKIIDELSKDVDTRRQVLIAVLNAMELACWESDENGKCIFASDKLSQIVGLNKEDIMNDGWVTNLLEEDKERVFHEWDMSVKQKRIFIMKYGFVHNNDAVVNVRAVASPIIVKGKLHGFIGILEEVK